MAKAFSGTDSPTGRRYSGLEASERARQRRSALLEAALQLFATRGYGASSVKQICRQAGLTERYFYESFSDRHDCLKELYLELAERMRTQTTAAIDDAKEAEIDEVARRALTAFVEYLTTDPRRARVVLIEVVGVSAEMERRRYGVLREFAELTTSVWLEGAGLQEATDRQRMTAVGLVGAVDHLLVDWLHGGQKETPGDLILSLIHI